MFEMNIFKKQVKNNWLLGLILTTYPVIIVLLMGLVSDTPKGETFQFFAIYKGINTQFVVLPPMIFAIICSNRMVVSEVQSGAMTYVASSPVSRNKIIGSKLLFLLSIQLYGFIMNLGVVTLIFVTHKGNIDVTYGALFMCAFGTALLIFALSSVSFFFSTYFNKVLLSHITGTVIIAAFYFISIIADIAWSGEGIADPLKFTKYITLCSLYNFSNFSVENSKNIAVVNTGATPFICYISLFLIGVGMFFGSGIVFNKKDLPL